MACWKDSLKLFFDITKEFPPLKKRRTFWIGYSAAILVDIPLSKYQFTTIARTALNMFGTKDLRGHTQRNIFEILSNQTEIRLYLPYNDWFGTKRTSVLFQINLCMANTIWFRFDLIRFRKYFSVCRVDRRTAAAGRDCKKFRNFQTFRKTYVSRHHGGPIEGPLKPSVHHRALSYWGV